MKVLITGAGGFIGSHLVDSQIAKGHQVRAVDLHLERLSHLKGHPNLEAVPGDLTDANFIDQIAAGVDIVYHLASAHLDVSLSDTYYKDVNVSATLSLLKAARDSGVKRFVHCSSVGVIGDVENPPADETTGEHPTNIYERTKLEGERAGLDFARKNGFPLVVIRPAWVYGPRCPRTAKRLRMISKGSFLIFGKGQNLRHPVYITDAVKGLELAADVDGVCGEVFIIAGNHPVRVSELVKVMSEELRVSPPKVRLPISLGLAVGYMLETAIKVIHKQPPFSRRSLDFFLKHNAYDISKARRMLDFQPQVDLRTGIQRTIQFAEQSTKVSR